MNRQCTNIKEWLPLIGITISAFIFNTAEFIPIGLLVNIASSFNISETHAGLLISVYALGVATLSLPLMILFSKTEYRKLLFCVIGFFVVNHIVAAISNNFILVLLSRIGVACSHAIFWSIVSPLAVIIAPKGKDTVALGMVASGTSIAMIAGLPLGRIIGLYWGWRMSFFSIAVASFSTLLLLFFCFPKVPNQQRIHIKELSSLFKNKQLISLNIFTYLAVTAHYTTYSYIEPYLLETELISDKLITIILMLFGLAGIGGSILFACKFTQYTKRFILFPIVVIACLLILMQLFSIHPYAIIFLCIVWGMTITIFNLVSQALVIRFAPQATIIAMALFSSIYNIGIGSGSIIGGAVETLTSIHYIGYAGGMIAIIAFIFNKQKIISLLDKQTSKQKNYEQTYSNAEI